MRIISLRGATRAFVLVVITAVPLLGVIDSGVVGYARLATEDDAKVVARAAADAVRGQPLTQQTALTAYEEADATARRLGATVARKDFTVHRDGQVTLTMERTAPTLIFDQLPFLRDKTDISVTVTVEPSRYS
jgi:hypothetical protein